MKKNVFILETERESRLFVNTQTNKLTLTEQNGESSSIMKAHHIYVTSGEVPKEGDWGIGIAQGINGVGKVPFLFKHDGSKVSMLNAMCVGTQKVIFSTDPKLVEDKVVTLTEEFLQWYTLECTNTGCFVDLVSIKRTGLTFNNKPKDESTSYNPEEKKAQIKKMKALGINVKGQTFEQMVNTVIALAENGYTREQMETISFGYYQHLAAEMGNFSVSKDDENYKEWVKTFKAKK